MTMKTAGRYTGFFSRRFNSVCRKILRAAAAVAMMVALVPWTWAAGEPIASCQKSSENDLLIRIHPEAQISGTRILLVDLADISTTNAGFREKAGRICFGSAPAPGKEKRISGRRMISRIKAEKWIPDNATITVPESVTVHRAFQMIPNERLEQLFHDYIGSRIRNVGFEISRFRVRGLKKLPTGELVLNVTLPSRSDICGRVCANVSALVDGREVETFTLSGWVDRYEPVVCARHAIAGNCVLSADDLALEPVNISKAPANLITRMEDAVGLRLKQRLNPGDYLRSNMLERPPMVCKGDRVNLIAGNGRLSVTTVGIAKDSGAKGDQIPVENLSSGKTVVGRITDPSTVEVLF